MCLFVLITSEGNYETIKDRITISKKVIGFVDDLVLLTRTTKELKEIVKRLEEKRIYKTAFSNICK